jgi:hypothetical protein
MRVEPVEGAHGGVPRPIGGTGDHSAFGEVAAALLLAVIDGAEPPPFELALPELIVRSSTGPAPPRPIGSAR